LQQNKLAYTVKMALAARRQIIGGGGPVNKSRRRRTVHTLSAARPAHCC